MVVHANVAFSILHKIFPLEYALTEKQIFISVSTSKNIIIPVQSNHNHPNII